MVPIQMEGIGGAAAGIFDALCVVVLKIANWTSACCLKCIPNVPAVAFPVGLTVGLPFTMRTFDLDC